MQPDLGLTTAISHAILPNLSNKDFFRSLEGASLSVIEDKSARRIESLIKRRNKFSLIIAAASAIASLTILTILLSSQNRIDEQFIFIGPTLALFYGVLFITTVWTSTGKTIDRIYVELEVLRNRASWIGQEPPHTPSDFPINIDSPPLINAPIESKEGYFDQLVKINLDNLSEYYKLTKISTSNSFYASLYSGIIGFAILVAGVLLAFFSDKSVVGLVTVVSGVIVEFIAGIFFILYFRTVDKLKDYHDSLINVQNVLLSFKLMEDIENDAERVKMAHIVLNLMHGAKLKDK